MRGAAEEGRRPESVLRSGRGLVSLPDGRSSPRSERHPGASLAVRSVSIQNPSDKPNEHERFMGLALEEARRARDLDEVPVGAVVVLGGQVVASAHNLTRLLKDPTAHAELLAVSGAARALGLMRLVGATVYSTVEPCFMCAGALSHARVARVVFGVRDPKFGGCVSIGRVLQEQRLNHRDVELLEGVLAEPARRLLVDFFQEKRRQARGELEP